MNKLLRSFLTKITSAKRLRKAALSTLIIVCFFNLRALIIKENKSPQSSPDQIKAKLFNRPPVNFILSEVVIRYEDNQYMLISQNFVTTSFHISGKYVKSPNNDQFKYFNLGLNDDNTKVIFDQNASLTEERKIPKEIYEIGEYFNVLKTQTGNCSKLHPFGGYVTCLKEKGAENLFDGLKELQIENSVHPEEKCLVMSFGINFDTTFDDAMEDAGCEVFMFDGFNFEKPYFKTEKFMHFHQMALGTKRENVFVQANNYTLEFDSFENIMVSHGLTKRLITVLKMDIEGNEWTVLRDLCSKPFLELIGQIAVEVHANEMLLENSSEQLRVAREMTGVLRCLEDKGFRRVSYIDTPHRKHKITDKAGTRHEFAGELLLVNSNWFNKEFRNYLYKDGYNLKSFP